MTRHYAALPRVPPPSVCLAVHLSRAHFGCFRMKPDKFRAFMKGIAKRNMVRKNVDMSTQLRLKCAFVCRIEQPFKIFIGFIQVASTIPDNFRLVFPPIVIKYFDWMRYLDFDIFSFTLNFRCALPFKYDYYVVSPSPCIIV